MSWVFIGRTDVEAETTILWPPDAKSWLTWKDLDTEKDWGQEKKGTTQDEMVGWHHWLNGHGFRWTPAVGDGQGGLACCGSWGRKESDTTERLNWTDVLGYKTNMKNIKRIKVIQNIFSDHRGIKLESNNSDQKVSWPWKLNNTFLNYDKLNIPMVKMKLHENNVCMRIKIQHNICWMWLKQCLSGNLEN